MKQFFYFNQNYFNFFTISPIKIPRNDPFYSRFNRRCNNFVRNAVGIKNDCTLGYREQTNVITSFFDASPVYGNDLNRSRIVRTFKNGTTV